MVRVMAIRKVFPGKVEAPPAVDITVLTLHYGLSRHDTVAAQETCLHTGRDRYHRPTFTNRHLVVGYPQPVMEPAHQRSDKLPRRANADITRTVCHTVNRSGRHNIRLEKQFLASFYPRFHLGGEAGIIVQGFHGVTQTGVDIVDSRYYLCPGLLAPFIDDLLEQYRNRMVGQLRIESDSTNCRTADINLGLSERRINNLT